MSAPIVPIVGLVVLGVTFYAGGLLYQRLLGKGGEDASPDMLRTSLSAIMLFLHIPSVAAAADTYGPHLSERTRKRVEREKVFLLRSVDDLNNKLSAIARTGTHGMLDRLDELSLYYENIRSRFERHSEWLTVQIGSYQSDLVALGRDH